MNEPTRSGYTKEDFKAAVLHEALQQLVIEFGGVVYQDVLRRIGPTRQVDADLLLVYALETTCDRLDGIGDDSYPAWRHPNEAVATAAEEAEVEEIVEKTMSIENYIDRKNTLQQVEDYKLKTVVLPESCKLSTVRGRPSLFPEKDGKKVCSRCKIEKPVKDFNLTTNKTPKSICRKCLYECQKSRRTQKLGK